MQIADWHKRYLEQAQWTEPLRRYILRKIPIGSDWAICEFGCATGAILHTMEASSKLVVGIDIDLELLTLQDNTKAIKVNADALLLPFQEKSFDLVFCHYFLLWVSDPVAVLKAARKLLKLGAYMAVFAEPDYASRQTLPDALKKLADLQNHSLIAQGANLTIGSDLGQLLKGSGFSIVEYGSIKEKAGLAYYFSESEKDVLFSDWEYLDKRQKSPVTLKEFEELLKISPKRWHVPTYYALASLNE